MSKNKIVVLLCPVAFLLFGIYVRVACMGMPRRDATFPAMISYLVIAIAIALFIFEWRKNDHTPVFANVNFKKLLIYTAVLSMYVLTMKQIGYFIGTVLLTGTTMYILEYRRYTMLVLMAFGITAFIFAMFKYLLRVPLPTLFL